uniref:Uncharacterized protein n=1 Tax=viral metagenome TaxID=1070528 RepID=A0A6M3KI71_9ZZZZ
MRFDLWETERAKAQIVEGGLLALLADARNGKPSLKVWKPKAKKPHINYYFKTVEERDKYLQNAIQSHKDHQVRVENRKADRKGTPEMLDSVKIGAIFHFSWGYDQTNVDFYQVVERSGYMLTLREICGKTADKETGNGMADYVVAVKDAFVKDLKPFKKKLQFIRGTPYITMKSYGWCSLWDGQPCYRSWYA